MYIMSISSEKPTFQWDNTLDESNVEHISTTDQVPIWVYTERLFTVHGTFIVLFLLVIIISILVYTYRKNISISYNVRY